MEKPKTKKRNRSWRNSLLPRTFPYDALYNPSTPIHSMRKLKHHEQKLMKKVNFFDWKSEADHRESRVIHRYHLQEREDYHQYNKICGLVTALISKVKQLPMDDPFRIKVTEQLLEKLHNMGIIDTRENIQSAEKVSVSAFCRRRLGVIMHRLKFAETMKEAVTFIEQGHIRIGPEVVTDPAFLVTRPMEDHITWQDTSSIKKKILKYKDKLDDYDMQN